MLIANLELLKIKKTRTLRNTYNQIHSPNSKAKNLLKN